MDTQVLTFDIPEELLQSTDFGNAFARKRLLQDCAVEWRLARQDLSLEEVEGEWKILVEGNSARRLQEWMQPEIMIAVPDGVTLDMVDEEQIAQVLVDCAVQLGLDPNDLMLVEDAESGEPCIVACGDSLQQLLSRRT